MEGWTDRWLDELMKGVLLVTRSCIITGTTIDYYNGKK